MTHMKRPKTAHGPRPKKSDESIGVDDRWYNDMHIDKLVDHATKVPLNPPPIPQISHSVNRNRRPTKLPTDSLQSFQQRNISIRKASKNQPLQLAKERQSPHANGIQTTTNPSSRQRNNRSVSTRLGDEEEIRCDQQNRPFPHRKRPPMDGDYLSRPIPRKSNSSTSFEGPIGTAEPSSSPTKYEAGKVLLNLCDGENSETEWESSSSHRAAQASSDFTIYSRPNSASSSDRSLCSSPAPERPTPANSSSTLSSQKKLQPHCIELPDEDDEKRNVDTPGYMDYVEHISNEAVVLASTTTPLSQSPSRSFVFRHVESAVASVQKTCSSFLTKVNAPKSKPQKQGTFFAEARRHAAHRIVVGSTIPFTAAKDDRDGDSSIDEYEDDDSLPLRRGKRNSRPSIADDEEYRPENERPRKGLKQTKLTTGNGTLEVASLPTRRSKRKSVHNQRQENSVIEIESSSDDEPFHEPEPKVLLSQDPISVDLVPLKISIGRNVFHHAQVHLNVHPRLENQCKIVLSYKNETRRRSKGRTRRSGFISSSDKVEERSHMISLGVDLREVRFYFHNQVNDNDDTERFDHSFLALNVKANSENGLALYSKSYKPDSDIDLLRNIVLVFSNLTDLDQILLALQRNSLFSCYVTDASRITASKALAYCQAVLEDQALERHDEKAQFLVGKDPDEILLLYPFGDSAASLAMDEEAHGLSELSCVLNRENMAEETLYSTNATVEPKIEKANVDIEKADADAEKDDGLGEESKTVLAFSVSTIERLGPGVYLNDTLIDFWLQWIWRNCDKSNIHYFTTLFFTTLEKKGTNGVARWTEKRGVDIFTKKFIFIPINKSLHWSLCVVINPGAIVEHMKMLEGEANEVSNATKGDDPFPCLLFFDSLNTHARGRFGKLVRTWLNSEWQRLRPKHAIVSPFTINSMKLLSPNVPQQMNSWDCGVYVCRYAYAMYLLRKSRFTYSDVEYMENTAPFKKLITEHDAFRFDADDIHRIREEYLSLLERLSKLYLSWKEDDDRKRIEARRAKKMEVDRDRRDERKTPCDEGDDVVVEQHDLDIM